MHVNKEHVLILDSIVYQCISTCWIPTLRIMLLMAKLDPAREWLWHGWSHSSFWEQEASGVKDLPSKLYLHLAFLPQDFHRFSNPKDPSGLCSPLLMQRFMKLPSINYLPINLNFPRQNMEGTRIVPNPSEKVHRNKDVLEILSNGSVTCVPWARSGWKLWSDDPLSLRKKLEGCMCLL